MLEREEGPKLEFCRDKEGMAVKRLAVIAGETLGELKVWCDHGQDNSCRLC